MCSERGMEEGDKKGNKIQGKVQQGLLCEYNSRFNEGIVIL